MEFTRAKKTDIDAIMNIVKEVQDNFKKQGINQWQDGYPSQELIEEDIENNESYVLKYEGVVMATSFFSFRPEEDYEKIYHGEWLSNGKYGVIHRIAIASKYRGIGLAYIFLKAMEQLCIDKGVYSIKVDTHKDNIAMQKLLEKNNFKKCGIIYLKNGAERLAYEKLL